MRRLIVGVGLALIGALATAAAAQETQTFFYDVHGRLTAATGPATGPGSFDGYTMGPGTRSAARRPRPGRSGR